MEALCVGRGKQYVRGARVDEGRLSSGKSYSFVVEPSIIDWDFPPPVIGRLGKAQIVVEF